MSTDAAALIERYELKLEKLKSLRDGVDWASEKERGNAVRRLYEIICNWKERLPDLRDLFGRQQLEQLMVDSMNLKCQGKYNFVAKRLIKFVALCGYRDDEKKTTRPVVHRRSTPLHHAAAKNIDYLIAGLFRIYDNYAATYADEHGLTHFHIACRFNRVDVVRAYLDLGRDPNYLARDPVKGHVLRGVEPPLHTALLHNCRQTAWLLMSRGADTMLRNFRGETPLHSICRRDKRHHADHLLRFFFKWVGRLGLPAVWVEARDQTGHAPLHFAARSNDLHSVRLLLRQAKANPIVRNHDQQTAMHLACQMQDEDPVEMVELYYGIMDGHWLPLASGMDPRDWFGWTPLNYALMNGQERVVELLIKRGANPNAPNYRRNFQAGLHILARRPPEQAKQSLRMMAKMYELTEPRIDQQDARGNTPLLLTLQHGCYKLSVFLALLGRGASPNVANFQGSTPLHLICQERNRAVAWDLARLLIINSRTKIEIDPRDQDDRTPLHYALMRRHEDICRALLQLGADPNSPSEVDGRSLLHHACKIKDRRRSFDRVRMLLELSESMGYGAQLRSVQVDARDKWANTPLHLALIAGNRELADLLLRRGADPNAVNESGLSALHFVCRAGGASNAADELARTFFRVFQAEEPARIQLIECDCRDKKTGDTPLHLALRNGHDWTSRELMRRTWDLQARNDAGLTPLHLICKRRLDDDLIETYFEIYNGESHRPRLRLDPRDGEDRTPLQYAVARLLPRAIKSLLWRGADLTSFAFPPVSCFEQPRRVRREQNFKLRLAIKVMKVVEALRDGGYELNRTDALTIMNLFSTYGLYESPDLDENWHQDRFFECVATHLTIRPRRGNEEEEQQQRLSLYDLVQLPPEAAARRRLRLGHAEYLELAGSAGFWELPRRHREACLVRLCEIVARGFFDDWGLECFTMLTRCRLPILCSEMVLSGLSNRDLWSICLASEL